MLATITFYIFLIGLIAFLQRKVSLLRKGKIEIQTVHKDRSHKKRVVKQIIRYVAHRIKDWLKDIFIKFASWRIRAKARINYFIENKLPGLYLILTKRPEIEEKHTKNIFWRGVIEYKYKIQRLKAQILEEEIQKISDKDVSKDIEQEMIKDIITEVVQETLGNEPLIDTLPTLHEDALQKKELTKNSITESKSKTKRVAKSKKIEVLRPVEDTNNSKTSDTKVKKTRNTINF